MLNFLFVFLSETIERLKRKFEIPKFLFSLILILELEHPFLEDCPYMYAFVILHRPFVYGINKGIGRILPVVLWRFFQLFELGH